MTTMSVTLRLLALFLVITNEMDASVRPDPIVKQQAQTETEQNPSPSNDKKTKDSIAQTTDNEAVANGAGHDAKDKSKTKPKCKKCSDDVRWFLTATDRPFVNQWDCKFLGTLCHSYDCASIVKDYGANKLPTESIHLPTPDGEDKLGAVKDHWKIEGSHPGVEGKDQLRCVSYDPTGNVFLGIVETISDDGKEQAIQLAKLVRKEGNSAHDIEIVPPPQTDPVNRCTFAQDPCNENARWCHTETYDPYGHFGYPLFEIKEPMSERYPQRLCPQKDIKGRKKCMKVVCLEESDPKNVKPWVAYQAILACEGTFVAHTVWFHPNDPCSCDESELGGTHDAKSSSLDSVMDFAERNVPHPAALNKIGGWAGFHRGRFTLSSYPYKHPIECMPHKRLTMTLNEFLSEQIGEETVDQVRWKKVHELFPEEFRDIQYWGDMMHWLMKGLTPKGKQHYSDVLNDLLRFQEHKDWMKQHFEKFRECKYNLPEKIEPKKEKDEESNKEKDKEKDKENDKGKDKENEEGNGNSAGVTEENLKYWRCQNMRLGPWDIAAHAVENNMWETPWNKPPVQDIPEKVGSDSKKNKESTGEEVSEEEQAKYTKARDGEVTQVKEEEEKKEPPSGSLRRMPSVLVAMIFVAATVVFSF